MSLMARVHLASQRHPHRAHRNVSNTKHQHRSLTPLKSLCTKRSTDYTPSQLRPRRIDFNINVSSPSTPSTSSSIFIRGGVGPSTDSHGNVMAEFAATPLPLNRVPTRRTSRDSKVTNPSRRYLARGLRSNSQGTNRSHSYNTCKNDTLFVVGDFTCNSRLKRSI